LPAATPKYRAVLAKRGRLFRLFYSCGGADEGGACARSLSSLCCLVVLHFAKLWQNNGGVRRVVRRGMRQRRRRGRAGETVIMLDGENAQ